MLVMVAYTKIPFTFSYFATAAKAILLLSSADRPSTSCQSFRLGLYLFQLMIDFSIKTKEQKIKVPMSLGVNHQVESPIEEEWNRQYDGMTGICLSVHCDSPIVKSNPTVRPCT
jgi:hypothetical protein